MRIACIYGKFSSQIHGQFDIEGLYYRQALTGSESLFFNHVRGLSELGFQVDAFCDVPQYYGDVKSLSGAHVHPIHVNIGADYDAYLSWNEPDQLRRAPADKLRICFQQLNDFTYCTPEFDEFVDIYVSPSNTHRDYLYTLGGVTREKFAVLANSTNLEFFAPREGCERDPNRIVWCSSPDRGLHRLLEIFPLIRAQNPKATLRIFYRLKQWYETARHLGDEIGQRARYIAEALYRLGSNGENGVFLVDAVSNAEMALELMQASVLPYTCDTVRFTEGFSVTILDACAAGCVPIISDADAIGEVYRDIALVIQGKPGDGSGSWIKATTHLLGRDIDVYRDNCRQFAKAFARPRIARMLAELVVSSAARKRRLAEYELAAKTNPEAVKPAAVYEPTPSFENTLTGTIEIDSRPPELVPGQLLDMVKLLWKHLLRHDEILGARRLLENAPWQIRDHADVRAMRDKTDKMLIHIDSMGEYVKMYTRYGDEVDAIHPLPNEIPEKDPMRMRLDFALAGLTEIQAEMPDARVKVIDIGCMTGWLTNRLGLRGAECIGIDASERAIALARQEAERVSSGATFKLAFIDEYLHGSQSTARYAVPNAHYDGHADLVIAFEIYEHVPDPVMFLRSVSRMARAGGRVLVSTPRGSWCQGLQVPFHERWDLERPREHIRAATAADLERDMKAAGLMDIVVKEVEVCFDIDSQAELLASGRVGVSS